MIRYRSALTLGSFAAFASAAPWHAVAQSEQSGLDMTALVGAPHFFSAVSGAVAIACALSAASLWRQSAAQTARIKRLEARLRSDLSVERVFVMHNGQPTPASPSTDAFMRTQPDTKTLTNRAKLRQLLARESNEQLEPLLNDLMDTGAAFEFAGHDVNGAPLSIRGETHGVRAVLRLWPELRKSDLAHSSLDRKELAATAADALNKAPLGAMLFDAEQRLVELNSAARRLLRIDGDPPAALRPLLDALRETRRLPERLDYANWRKSILNDPIAAISREPLWPMPDGDVLRVTAAPTVDDGLAIFMSDETGSLTQERRAKTAQSVQLITIAAIDDGLAVVSSEGRVQLVNPAFRRLWAFDPSRQLEGERFADLLDVSEADLLDAEAWMRITNAISASGPPRADAFASPRGNGRRLATKLTPLPDGATLIACQDVGDAHRIETALRERNEALEEADRLKTEFLKAIASQLRTPLHTVMGYADVLLKEGSGPLTKRQRDYVQGVMNTGDELLSLVSDAVDLGALRAGAIELQRARLDVRRVIEDVSERITGRARARGVRLQTEVPAREITIDGDEARLEQAVYALATAAFAIGEHGDSMTLRAGAEGAYAKIEICFERARAAKPAAYAGHAEGFSPFLDGTESAVGISLATQIADLHGGGLSITQNNDGGQATVRLPRLRKSETPSLEDAA